MNERLEKWIAAVPRLRVTVVGDACIDAYWDVDMTQSELSREVPQFPYPVTAERYSLGAGANVAANVSALGAGQIAFVGTVGTDWRAAILHDLFTDAHISSDYLLPVDGRVTPAYCKPILHGISPVTQEAPRIDFGNRAPLADAFDRALCDRLDDAAAQSDVLIVCDQWVNGTVSDRIRARLTEWGQKMPVLVDSRDHLTAFSGAVIKPNEVEAARALGLPPVNSGDIPAMCAMARQLEQKTGNAVLLTLGAHGALWCEHGECTHRAGFSVPEPLDFVGAGDAFLASFSLAYALHTVPADALTFACLTSAITIRKLGATGTASPDELRAAAAMYLGDVQ